MRSQQVRFLIAGSGNTALDFLMLNLLTLGLGLRDVPANSISVVIGVCISYLLNHLFVFRYPYRVSWRKFASFFAVTGFSSLVLQNLIIWAFETMFQTEFGHSLLLFAADSQRAIELNIAKAVAVGVGLVWNFLFYRFVVFRLSTPAEPDPASVEDRVDDPADDPADDAVAEGRR